MSPETQDREIRRELAELAGRGLRRERAAAAGLDFVSNDYLGWSRDPATARAIAERIARAADEGERLLAPASRLLGGETPTHARLEARLAAWKGHAAALVFPSGYQANVALLATLAGRGDRIVSDALAHASLIDGARLAGAEKRVVPHGDLAACERELATPHAGRTLLVTESIFSMDGDAAPLPALVELARRHGAWLIVDEAHAAGVFGRARGSGLLEELGLESAPAATVTTFGKALGLAGACVSGSAATIDLLVQRARPFVFSTAVPPLALLALEAMLDRLADEPGRRERLRANAARLRAALAARGVEVPPGAAPIVPVVVGENEAALAVARRVRADGFDVRAVRPPTVPAGTARLRLSVHADHRPEDLDRLAERIALALAAVVGVTAEDAAR